MNTLILNLLIPVFYLSNFIGQDNVKTIEYKKGEVLDILILKSAPKSKELFNNYKKSAFPVAFEYSYQPQPGFKISKLTLGNNLPSSLVFGKWDNLKMREGFLSEITNRVPDFHHQRRDIFTYFGLTYYQLNQDLKFTINSDKYYVSTSFWESNKREMSKFWAKWKSEVIKSGGKIILNLRNGISPTGYTYNPDVFCIVEFNSKSEFESFQKNNPLAKYEDLENVHQFVID